MSKFHRYIKILDSWLGNDFEADKMRIYIIYMYIIAGFLVIGLIGRVWTDRSYVIL